MVKSALFWLQRKLRVEVGGFPFKDYASLTNFCIIHYLQSRSLRALIRHIQVVIKVLVNESYGANIM